MNDRAALSGRDEENLVRAVEFSMPIRRRNQFFLWTQGALQGLIPHEVLFCVYGTPSDKACMTHQYTSAPFPQGAYRDICSPTHGLLVMSHAEWQRCGNTPLLLSRHGGAARHFGRLGETLVKHELGNCAVHGMPPVNGTAGSLFFFARMPDPLQPRQAYVFDLILPYLHVAYLRTLMNAERAVLRAATADLMHGEGPSPGITGRELQILQWLYEGKSNREIAEILKISPFTVKNHVQNILKKLHVRNRTQAVAFALSLHLIKAQLPRDSP